MPYPNEHAARLRQPGGFQADSFRRKKIAPGVSLILGRPKGKTTMTAQAYRFDKANFTAAEARKWLRDHDVKPLSFEAASSKEAELEKAAIADPLAPETAEIIEVEAKMYDDHYPAEPLVPMGATTFAEVDAFRQAQGVHEQVKELTTMFQTLSSNVMWDPTIEDKPGALRGLVDELDGLLADAITEKARPSALARLIGKAKDLAASVSARLSPEQEKASGLTAGLMVWKEGGVHRWFAIYSNKYRDQDVPPEILSAKAHKQFVEAVDTGAAPYPELWHYHVPGSRWGISDWLAFDQSTGFSLASGTVDKGHEKEAEAIMALSEPLAVSHSLEVLERSKEDPTIIESYRTSEISDLPVVAAANKLTGFTLTKGAHPTMTIPAEKKAHLLKVGLTPARIEEIEGDLAGKAKAAEGLQSKEAEAPVPPTPDPAPAPNPEPEPAPWAGDLAALRVEMATAITDVLTGQKAIADAVVLMAKSDEARIAKAAADTPALSIAALVMKNLSAIGTNAARVGVADMGLAKDKPKEVTSAEKSTGVPWIDEMIAGPAQ